ncbi:lytic transglycosylase domain-containing protein [Nocardioides taihuensis]|uniref:Lytic transglycosylase domain-containing protein n=1 Tax=Nocardioides taihuensis TaxID=1835606 RepID=A0ABW0BHQ8_9ACTN
MSWRYRGCAVAAILALPLALNPSEGVLASLSHTPAPAASEAEVTTLAATVRQLDALAAYARAGADHAQRTVEVKTSTGTVTWTASSLTDNGLPSAARRAYVRAASSMAQTDPACQVPWTLLAGIGRVESDHGRDGGSVLGADGVSHPLIIGVTLDGSGPVAAIRDTDDGRFDKDPVWDHAVGPMQFIPSSWAAVARDGDGDGVKSPNDIDDAALATAAYLCSGSGSVLGETAMRAAIYSYNHSRQYVALVMAMEVGYRTGVFIMPTFGGHHGGKHAHHGGKHAHHGGHGGSGSGGHSSTGDGGGQSGGGGGGSTGGGSTGGGGGGGSTGGGGGGSTGGGGGSTGGGGGGGGGGSTPPPDPTTEQKSGTLATCGSGWCLDGWALDLGGDAVLAQTATHDYDGDGASGETNQQELEGLAGVNVTVVVSFGTATVLKLQGLAYP